MKPATADADDSLVMRRPATTPPGARATRARAGVEGGSGTKGGPGPKGGPGAVDGRGRPFRGWATLPIRGPGIGG
jgi:hypothetical protein